MFKRHKTKNIFELAQESGKKLVFIFFEDKVFVTLAEKKIDGTITFEISKGLKTETYNLQIQPEQEFLLHTPKIEVSSKLSSAQEYILNFDIINIKPGNPKDVEFKLQPYNIECIFLVYPHELMNYDSLKNLGLIKIGQRAAEIGQGNNKQTLIFDVYSPTAFLIDKQTVKTLSAKSRISQIDTILSMTRDLLLKSEGLLKVDAPHTTSLLKMIFNWRILIPIILLTIIIFSVMFLSQNMTTLLGGFSNTFMPPLPQNITTITRFP